MKRLIFSVMSFCLLGISVFAGDVSVFKEIGFSKDGNTYIFGTYGKTDKKFIPYPKHPLAEYIICLALLVVFTVVRNFIPTIL